MYDIHLFQCVDCPFDEYQDQQGQATCIACGEGLGTLLTRSDGVDDCVGKFNSVNHSKLVTAVNRSPFHDICTVEVRSRLDLGFGP